MRVASIVRLLADVADLGATRTGYMIAAAALRKRPLAPVASSYHCLDHTTFDVRPHPRLRRILDFAAAEWDVTPLSAQPGKYVEKQLLF